MEAYLTLESRGVFKRKDLIWEEKAEITQCDSTCMKGLRVTKSLSGIYEEAVLHQAFIFFFFAHLQDKTIYTTRRAKETLYVYT